MRLAREQIDRCRGAVDRAAGLVVSETQTLPPGVALVRSAPVEFTALVRSSSLSQNGRRWHGPCSPRTRVARTRPNAARRCHVREADLAELAHRPARAFRSGPAR